MSRWTPGLGATIAVLVAAWASTASAEGPYEPPPVPSSQLELSYTDEGPARETSIHYGTSGGGDAGKSGEAGVAPGSTCGDIDGPTELRPVTGERRATAREGSAGCSVTSAARPGLWPFAIVATALAAARRKRR
jgi:MYXO-CTERM domain-containing protein